MVWCEGEEVSNTVEEEGDVGGDEFKLKYITFEIEFEQGLVARERLGELCGPRVTNKVDCAMDTVMELVPPKINPKDIYFWFKTKEFTYSQFRPHLLTRNSHHILWFQNLTSISYPTTNAPTQRHSHPPTR